MEQELLMRLCQANAIASQEGQVRPLRMPKYSCPSSVVTTTSCISREKTRTLPIGITVKRPPSATARTIKPTSSMWAATMIVEEFQPQPGAQHGDCLP
mgnify:CR=1 FL=1